MGFNLTADESFQMGMNSREKKLDEIERRLTVVEKKLESDVRENVPGEWIPCSERLPEDCEDVFVTVKLQDAGQDPEYHVDAGSYSRCWQTDQHGRRIAAGGVWSYCNDWYEGQDVCEVIAWMPVPKPWKESEVEK